MDTRTCVSPRRLGDVPSFLPRDCGLAWCTPLGARQWIHARASVYGVYAAFHVFPREGDFEVDAGPALRVDGECAHSMLQFPARGVSLGKLTLLRPLVSGSHLFGSVLFA